MTLGLLRVVSTVSHRKCVSFLFSFECRGNDVVFRGNDVVFREDDVVYGSLLTNEDSRSSRKTSLVREINVWEVSCTEDVEASAI